MTFAEAKLQERVFRAWRLLRRAYLAKEEMIAARVRRRVVSHVFQQWMQAKVRVAMVCGATWQSSMLRVQREKEIQRKAEWERRVTAAFEVGRRWDAALSVLFGGRLAADVACSGSIYLLISITCGVVPAFQKNPKQLRPDS